MRELIGTDYSDEDFLEAVERCSPASTREIADEVGCSIQTVRDRMKRLLDADRVEGKIDSTRSRWIWMEAE